jgi:hypothetical protein
MVEPSDPSTFAARLLPAARRSRARSERCAEARSRAATITASSIVRAGVFEAHRSSHLAASRRERGRPLIATMRSHSWGSSPRRIGPGQGGALLGGRLEV